MTKGTNIGKCKLCGQESKIIRGHVIPKFAIDWLKRTSATPYIRQALNSNLPRQDIRKLPLLCAGCERLFSTWEGQFAQELFIPFQEKGQQSFSYGDWLLSFTVSLAWRMATVEVDSFRKSKPELAKYVDKALNCWHAFLLGRSKDSGPYEHHLFFLDYVADAHSTDLPDKINWYLLRSFDATIVSSSRSVFIYYLLPRLVFWSCIEPSEQEGWKGTRILERGTIAPPQVAPSEFGDFLLNRVQVALERVGQISDIQRTKIADNMLKDPARTLASRSWEMLQFEYLRKRMLKQDGE